MGLYGSLSRFAAKPRHQKWSAIRTTVRALLRQRIPDTPKYARAAGSLIEYFCRHGKQLPKILLFYGSAPGDDMFCTAVLHELRRRRDDYLGMVSNHPGLFLGNADVVCVLPAGKTVYDRSRPPLATYRHLARLWGGQFKRVEYSPFDGVDRSVVPSRHVIAELCASAGISGRVAIRPYLNLTDAEKAATVWAQGRIAIQSSSLAGGLPMHNKQWFPERFQQVVNALEKEYEFIQIGLIDDPPLAGAIDLRSKTTVRESAAILHNVRLYVGLEGFPMHLARAVECPSVIIFGGRVAPWQIGYICNTNLYTPLPCSPCWRWNSCELDRQCMREISADDVVAAIRQMLVRPRGPLEVESLVIADPAASSSGTPPLTQ